MYTENATRVFSVPSWGKNAVATEEPLPPPTKKTSLIRWQLTCWQFNSKAGVSNWKVFLTLPLFVLHLDLAAWASCEKYVFRFSSPRRQRSGTPKAGNREAESKRQNPQTNRRQGTQTEPKAEMNNGRDNSITSLA